LIFEFLTQIEIEHDERWGRRWGDAHTTTIAANHPLVHGACHLLQE